MKTVEYPKLMAVLVEATKVLDERVKNCHSYRAGVAAEVERDLESIARDLAFIQARARA